MGTPTLERLAVYPVKSLDPLPLEEATVMDDGGLSHDREFAIVDAADRYVNAKNDRRVHQIRSAFDPDAGRLTLRRADGPSISVDVDDPADREALEEWLGEFFEREVELRRDETGGFPDDQLASGPTLIAEATIAEVASWYDGITMREMERRLRPNLIVSGVEAFWEDRLYRDEETAVAFRVGDAEFVGANPCARCVVPSRDPETGAETSGFRETFMRRRRATLPPWASEAWFDHYFRLMVNTFVPEETVGASLAVGDQVEILGECPYPG